MNHPVRHACLVLLVGTICRLALAESLEQFGTNGNQFTMIFVDVGSIGNLADTSGTPNPCGAVGYNYRIGKYQVSRTMVEKANAEAGLGITLADVDWAAADKPATGISWNEAARFVNWLNESQGFPHAYKFSLQPGDVGYNSNTNNIELWDVGDSAVDSRGINQFRHKNAKYFLPNVDEWYKAAYYDPTTASYFAYPTGSNSPPIPIASGAGAGTAVYSQALSQGPADITLAGGLSPFATMGQGGNAIEWLETNGTLDPYNQSVFTGLRRLRGGHWNNSSGALAATNSSAVFPNSATNFSGFRVAALPGIGSGGGASIVAAHVYYAGSSFASESVAAALDPNKTLAKEGLSSQLLNYQNLTNTSRGINGLAFDLSDLPGAPTAADFVFQMSPPGAFVEGDHPPVLWQAAPAPSAVTLLVGSPDRVIIQWPDNAIANRWLRVTVKANDQTGLSVPEVYYLGHLLGEMTGDQGGVYSISNADVSQIRTLVGQNAAVGTSADIDKNSFVNNTDISLMRSGIGVLQLTNITIPAVQ